MSAVKPAVLAGLNVAVLAGGLGTRLRGVLDDRPKILAPVAGRAFLDHLLDAFALAGVERVLLCLGHMADSVLSHLKVCKPALSVDCIVEPHPLGTGGALRYARSRLRGDRLLVVNGDTWLGFDLPRLAASFDPQVMAGTLVYVEVDDAGRYGRLDINHEERITAFLEKDATHHGGGMVNGGVYLLSDQLLDQLSAGTAISLERDFLEKLPPRTLHAFRASGPFIDIGTPESLAIAGSVVRQAMFGRAV
ncbi:nucleotidyl transferase [Ferrovibrio terrae]|uniref:Nucleotidyl transferase n=1 Tax=Ferrovibrio terrae TaxID=2594003 RepID=A0A516GXT8_9PROT|nr:sugar phosphate nucleotidyltransferase [Ferrovibrio terrae]QDO96333.1 nucleotidyl transferase [Ferrovibrio terrae]